VSSRPSNAARAERGSQPRSPSALPWVLASSSHHCTHVQRLEHALRRVPIKEFQKGLAYSLGNQWNELECTTAEFKELTDPYLSRVPKKPGDPDPFVKWQEFTTHVQALADQMGSGKAGDY